MSDPATENYLVALDPSVGYCRLFRTGSEEGAGLDPLWTGFGLRRHDPPRQRPLPDRSRPRVQPAGKPGRTIYQVFKGHRRGGLGDGGQIPRGAEAAGGAGCCEGFSNGQGVRQEPQRTPQAWAQASSAPRLGGTDLRYIWWLESTRRIAA